MSHDYETKIRRMKTKKTKKYKKPGSGGSRQEGWPAGKYVTLLCMCAVILILVLLLLMLLFNHNGVGNVIKGSADCSF